MWRQFTMGREGLYALCPQCPCAGVLYSIVKKGIDYTLRILDRGRTWLPGCRVGPHVSQWQPGPFLVPALGPSTRLALNKYN